MKTSEFRNRAIALVYRKCREIGLSRQATLRALEYEYQLSPERIEQIAKEAA